VGTARRRVAEELRAVADVRAQGYSAEAAKPRVFYDRVFLKVDDDAGRARAKYELRIDTGHAERKRELLLTLNKRDAGKWRVASFSFQDALDP
jgi:hypothetical protein